MGKHWLLGAVAAVCLSAAVGCTGGNGATASSAAPASTASAAPPASAAACTKARVTITTPKNGALVPNGARGVVVRGYACLPSGAYVYAFDSTDQGVYNMDSPNVEGSTGPIVQRSGNFTWRDYPMGDAQQDRQPNTITLVIADGECRDGLGAVRPDGNGDVVVKEFPAGCVRAATVTVRVTNK